MKYPQVFIQSKIISEAVYTMGDPEGTLQTEYDDISMKKKLVQIDPVEFWNVRI